MREVDIREIHIVYQEGRPLLHKYQKKRAVCIV